MTILTKADGGSDAHRLTFEHVSDYNSGKKWPYDHTIVAVHPEHGQVGSVKYKMSGSRANSKILVDLLSVEPEHQRKGYATALMDQMQRQHPKSSINHGDRTDAGKGWWESYGRAADARGRTAKVVPPKLPPNTWKTHHQDLGNGKWRSRIMFPEGGNQHGYLNYRVHDGAIEFHNDDDLRDLRHQYANDVLRRSKDEVLNHHGLPERVTEQPGLMSHPTYYHGTERANLTHVLPATRHGGETNTDVSDSDYAYATTNPHDAWEHAINSWSGNGSGNKPRVYEVRPMHNDHSHIDIDPNHDIRWNEARDTFPSDRRSKVGWEVIRELPTHHTYLDDDYYQWPGKEEEKRHRTAVADWQFSHHHIEGPHWRSFGGPVDDPGRVMVQYKFRDGGVQFDSDTMSEYNLRKHGPEAVDRVQQAVRTHHNVEDAPPEAPPPPARPKPRTYYHGTTVEDVTHVLPASRHRQGVTFSSDTDPEYAYASNNKGDAWHYAEMAHYRTGKKPRVYQVRPLHGDHAHVEKDPQWDDVRDASRGNFAGDHRSKQGWEVVRELKTPRHIHENFDWPGKDEK